MQGDVLLSSLRDYHEIFRFASSELLFAIDKAFGHGTWRDWARFLQEALRLRNESGYETLDNRFAKAVMHRIREAQGNLP